MSEHDEQTGAESSEPRHGAAVPVVSEVLASIEALADKPVAEHVEVYEQAHERLRRALDQRHG